MFCAEAHYACDAPMWSESDSFDIGLSGGSQIYKGRFGNLQCGTQKMTYKFFMGLKILFIITWIIIKKQKKTTRIMSLKSVTLRSPGNHVGLISCFNTGRNYVV